MDPAVVVKEPLTSEMIAAGEALIERLDNSDFDLVAAFWLYNSEASQWRIVFVSPRVASEGSRRSYGRIHDALFKVGEPLEIDSLGISVRSPDDPLVKLLRTALRARNGTHGVRLSRNVINGTYIEDVYIYRL